MIEKTSYELYLNMIESEADLLFGYTFDKEFRYIVSEDRVEGQVIIAQFSLDGALINIYTDGDLNSIHEFMNNI